MKLKKKVRHGDDVVGGVYYSSFCGNGGDGGGERRGRDGDFHSCLIIVERRRLRPVRIRLFVALENIERDIETATAPANETRA